MTELKRPTKRPEPAVTEQAFLRDVKDHEITIIRNEGLHRHIRFKKPGSSTYAFDVLTFPGHAIITGDMGTFVFQRLPDMLQFFDDDKGINPSYWAEKLVSTDNPCGHHAFSPEVARYEILSRVFDYLDEVGDKEDSGELLKSIDYEVLSELGNGENDTLRAMFDFSTEGVFCFDYIIRLHDFTPQYLWCCYAIRHIAQIWNRRAEKEPSQGFVKSVYAVIDELGPTDPETGHFMLDEGNLLAFAVKIRGLCVSEQSEKLGGREL